MSGPFGLAERSTTGEVLPELLPGSAVTLTQTVSEVWPLGPLDVRVTVEPVTSANQTLDGAVEPATAAATVWAVSWTALGTVALLLAILIALWRVRGKIRALRSQSSTRTERLKADSPA